MKKYFLFLVFFTLQSLDLSREFGPFVKNIDEQDDLQCAICTGNSFEQWYCLKPCRHSFHYSCIDKWIRLHATCPSCRKNVVNYRFLPFTVAKLLEQFPNLGLPQRVFMFSTPLWNLDLTSKRLESLEGLEIIQERDQVHTLSLSSNSITRIPANIFIGFDNLEVLILDNNPITDVEPGAFARLSNLKQIFFTGHSLSPENQEQIKNEIAQVTNNQAKVFF